MNLLIIFIALVFAFGAAWHGFNDENDMSSRHAQENDPSKSKRTEPLNQDAAGPMLDPAATRH